MINAEQARQATSEKLKQLAKDFISNYAEAAIREETKLGKFFATVNFEGMPNPEHTGAEVVRLLQELGFGAEHVYYDGPNGYDNYILIKWEEE